MESVLAIRPGVYPPCIYWRANTTERFNLQTDSGCLFVFSGDSNGSRIKRRLIAKTKPRSRYTYWICDWGTFRNDRHRWWYYIESAFIAFPLGFFKEAAAVSALFIFVNSVSGLAGLKTWIPLDQSQMIYWLGASLVGGFLGARWGAAIASNTKVKWILALVLVIASLKLWFV